MAKLRSDLAQATSQYDRDFVSWTRQQAKLLRRAAARRPMTDLDFENLAEEIESLGKRDHRALTSNVARIIEHLLKLQHSRAEEPRGGQETSVDVRHSKARKVLADSLRLKPELQAALDESYEDGRRFAARALRREIDPDVLPERCPYSLDQILNRDWWP
jgi:Domain of unknown function DUF29